MVLGGMGLFLLEAGAGTAFLLLFFPTRALGPGFFALHGALACGFVMLASFTHPEGLGSVLGATAAVLLALYAAAALAGRAREALPLLGAGSLAALAALVR